MARHMHESMTAHRPPRHARTQRRRDGGDDGEVAVAAERGLQDARELGVPVRHVLRAPAAALRLAQCADHFAEVQQALVDVARLLCCQQDAAINRGVRSMQCPGAVQQGQATVAALLSGTRAALQIGSS